MQVSHDLVDIFKCWVASSHSDLRQIWVKLDQAVLSPAYLEDLTVDSQTDSFIEV